MRMLLVFLISMTLNRAMAASPAVEPTVGLTGAAAEPLRVFVLAGQSNMEGQSVADLDGPDYNEGRGKVPPNFLVATPSGLLAFIPSAMVDERAKDNLANTARLIGARCAATAAVLMFEARMRLAPPGGQLDMETPPSKALDRREMRKTYGLRPARRAPILIGCRTSVIYYTNSLQRLGEGKLETAKHPYAAQNIPDSCDGCLPSKESPQIF